MEGKLLSGKNSKKTSLIGNIKGVGSRSTNRFYSKDFKTQSIRASVHLKKQIYEFEIFEKDITDRLL